MIRRISMDDLQIVFFAITNICNCKCLTCDIGISNRKEDSDSIFLENLNFGVKEYTSPELLQRILEQLREIGPQLYITGGEPLISPIFNLFLEIFKDYSGRIDLVTNGTFLQKYIKAIANSSLASVNVSLDGFKATHDHIRGIPDLYEKVIAGITELRKSQLEFESKQELNINFTISKSNYAEIYDLAGMALEIGIDRVDFLHPQYVSPAMAETHNRRYPKMRVGTRMYKENKTYDIPLEDILRIVDRTKIEFGEFVAFFPDLTPEQLRTYYGDDSEFPIYKVCSTPFKGFEIIQNGDCIIGTPCVPYKVGNIMQDSLADIWLGKRFNQFRNTLLLEKRFPICAKCCSYYY
ncbi:MAG: radical SAM protein [Bacteroidales bacterium]|nr:radical SAM protein [Bacteroidales bacterium]